MGLSKKRKAWIEEYLICWNATEAARRVCFANPNTQGPRLLVDVRIQEEIQKRLDERAMTANEVVDSIGEVGRASIEDLMDVDDDGRLAFNFKRAKEQNKLHLIKSIIPTQYGTKVELHDRMKALELMGRHHGLFKDNLDITTKGESIKAVGFDTDKV